MRVPCRPLDRQWPGSDRPSGRRAGGPAGRGSRTMWQAVQTSSKERTLDAREDPLGNHARSLTQRAATGTNDAVMGEAGRLEPFDGQDACGSITHAALIEIGGTGVGSEVFERRE